MDPIDFTSIPNEVGKVIDEAELTSFIQESLIESGVVIREDDAREVSEIAFDYVVYKLTQSQESSESDGKSEK